MKYKVGEKVRVKTNLEVDKKYGDYCFTRDMEQYKGQIVTIANAYDECYDKYYYIEKAEGFFGWTDEMFEPITNFDKCKEELKMEDTEEGQPFCNAIHRVRKEKNCIGISCDKCRKWLKRHYKEHKDILDEEEKEYLSAVIKPFKKRVDYIQKLLGGRGEFIIISFDNDNTCLPYFERGTMYKGMKIEKRYTLKELGL